MDVAGNATAVAILDAALSILWNGKDEDEYRYGANLERHGCIAVAKGGAKVLELEYHVADEHPTVQDIYVRIKKRINGHYVASRFLSEEDANYDGTDEYVQNFRRKMLEDIRKELA